MLCWICRSTLGFERVQHAMRDGDISWGPGVHFDGVEMHGNDGEDMVIKSDKVVEDDVKDKKGTVLKNYLDQKILPGLGVVETVANLPAGQTQLAKDKSGQAPAAGQHLASGSAGAAPGTKRKDLAVVAKALRKAIARNRARIHTRIHSDATKASKVNRAVADAEARAAAADALSRLDEVGQWEREQEAEAQFHWGLHIGRVVWVIGLLVLLIPANPGNEQHPAGRGDNNYDNYDGAEVEMTES